MRGFLG